MVSRALRGPDQDIFVGVHSFWYTALWMHLCAIRPIKCMHIPDWVLCYLNTIFLLFNSWLSLIALLCCKILPVNIKNSITALWCLSNCNSWICLLLILFHVSWKLKHHSHTYTSLIWVSLAMHSNIHKGGSTLNTVAPNISANYQLYQWWQSYSWFMLDVKLKHYLIFSVVLWLTLQISTRID